MSSIDYLKSLIVGIEIGSEIPIQLCELKLLLLLLTNDMNDMN